MTLNSNAPIGIFDSGLGGLAVLREVRRLLPNEDVVFLGDTARQPYGPQPIEHVRQYAVENTAFLAQRGAKLVIIACNTASVAGRKAAQEFLPDLPVLGMIEPGVRAALRASQSGRIGVWGTAVTIDSKAYDDRLHLFEPGVQVLGAKCPELLRLAEKGKIDDRPHLLDLARVYYKPLADFGADILILGCTDLTCVRDIAQEAAGPDVVIVDPAEEVVLEARQILEEAGALRVPGEAPARYQFFVTGDDADNFASFTARFMEMAQVDVESVPLAAVQQAAAPGSMAGNRLA
jgi:glutamate racemase